MKEYKKPRIRNWMRKAFKAKDPELKALIGEKLFGEVEAEAKARKPKKAEKLADE